MNTKMKKVKSKILPKNKNEYLQQYHDYWEIINQAFRLTLSDKE